MTYLSGIKWIDLIKINNKCIVLFFIFGDLATVGEILLAFLLLSHDLFVTFI